MYITYHAIHFAFLYEFVLLILLIVTRFILGLYVDYFPR